MKNVGLAPIYSFGYQIQSSKEPAAGFGLRGADALAGGGLGLLDRKKTLLEEEAAGSSIGRMRRVIVYSLLF